MQDMELSADEIALYDRQLRLWGIEAQNRMRRANILLITMKALGNEIAKNFVLAGIGSLTVWDSESVTEDDVATEFFVTTDQIGMNRAEASIEDIQRLNPRVHVRADSNPVASKESKSYEGFDVVIATDIPLSLMIQVNEITRRLNVPSYFASLHGLCGIIFVDLIEHTTLVNGPLSNKDSTKTVATAMPKTEVYVSLKESFQTSYGKTLKPRQQRKVSALLPLCFALVSWIDVKGNNPTVDDLDEFSQSVDQTIVKLSLPATICTADQRQDFVSQLVHSNISGVAAVVGGILSQDVLNALGGRELPLKNWMLFDGGTCEGKIYNLAGFANGEVST